MSDESDNNRQELQRVQNELKKGGLSRRRFLDSMKGLGVGFGAAFLLGMNKADAAANAGVQVKSTNPAIDHIVEEGQAQQPHDTAEGAEPEHASRAIFPRLSPRLSSLLSPLCPLLPPRLSPLLPSCYRRFYVRF